MAEDFLQKFQNLAILEEDFNQAASLCSEEELAPIKRALAIAHRLFAESPSAMVQLTSWESSGLLVRQETKPATWALFHCPKTANAAHLAASLLIARLAAVEHIFVLFDEKPLPPCLMALEICGHEEDCAFVACAEESKSLLESLQEKGQGRLVFLGAPQEELALIALQKATPICCAHEKFSEQEAENIVFSNNLRPEFFTDDNLFVSPLDNKD